MNFEFSKVHFGIALVAKLRPILNYGSGLESRGGMTGVYVILGSGYLKDMSL